MSEKHILTNIKIHVSFKMHCGAQKYVLKMHFPSIPVSSIPRTQPPSAVQGLRIRSPGIVVERSRRLRCQGRRDGPGDPAAAPHVAVDLVPQGERPAIQIPRRRRHAFAHGPGLAC